VATGGKASHILNIGSRASRFGDFTAREEGNGTL